METEMIEGEEWREVPGFNGIYDVSSYGRVRSLRADGTRRVLVQANKKNGYKLAMFRLGGKQCALHVHRLVAKAFIPNPDVLPVVHHRDSNPSNNCATNLKWTTQRENIRMAMAIRGNWLMGHPRLTTKIVRVDPDSGERVKYDSVVEATKALNAMIVANGGVAKRCAGMAANICAARRRGGISYGFLWEKGETRGRKKKYVGVRA